jgi:Domain of unknown function (DUF6379)
MFEEPIIQSRGFRNVGDPGARSGFQLCIRTPYYRGMWLSMLEGADVTVDGERHSRAGVGWTIAGETYNVAELAAASDRRWPYEEPALLTVPHSGGLESGVHQLEVAVVYRMSYIPVELQPTTSVARRNLTMVAA